MTKRVTVETKSFKTGLGLAGKAVASRSTLPVLTHYLLTSDGAMLKIEGNNLEVGIRTSIPCKGDAFAITLPAKLLQDWVGSIRGETVELVFDDEAQKVKLESGGSKSNINGIDANDFPAFPTLDGSVAIVQFPADTLAHAVRTVAIAAAAEHTNPILQGVNIIIKGNVATFAAIDGYRLNVKPLMLDATYEPQTITIPARAAMQLASLLPNDSTAVSLSFVANGRQVLFTFGNVEMASRLHDGTFPDYERFIPPANDEHTRIIVDKKLLITAVKRIALFSQAAGNIIKIETSENGTIQLSANAAEIGDSIEQIDALFDQPELAKANALNVRYFQESLGVIETVQVALTLATSNSPILLRPVGAEGLCLIMPMRIP